MNVLVVFDHLRRNSLCGAVLDGFVSGLADSGHVAEVADLNREGFDPRMTLEDEPDWSNSRKTYSDAVLAEQARISRNQAIAFVFPIWWWSFPAMTKGWIDRVWNNGWAYGDRKLPHKKALLVGVGSGTPGGYKKRQYDESMRIGLEQGILNYCGIADARLELLLESLGDEAVRNGLVAKAGSLGRKF
jgi:NAD(P)H dehydrogenase (quinone)